ncbi:EAL domain-containing protein [Shewanella sp. C32]|uniref:EAL domain-containing protein n=1 Tax=Shewanella electrica TaxID=515560 RepID=A0ABT2FMX3_9GAMM|nr:EAL domain-containing protein [Shewanella electrica]MCH1926155.1 EAL domain-containing protein [Shewanella electrica]MCS4557681.1 EAL domain-containing protein [Shewanella electrica]
MQRVFTARDGLGSYNIHDISMDERGFTWLATETGLYRVSRNLIRRVDRYEDHDLVDEQFFTIVRVVNPRLLLVSSEHHTYFFDTYTSQFKAFGSGDTFPTFKDGALIQTATLRNGDQLLLSEVGNLWRLSQSGEQLTLLFALPTRQFEWNQLLLLDDQIIVANNHELLRFSHSGVALATDAWQTQYGTISSLAKDELQRVWIGSSKGLYQLSVAQGSVSAVPQLSYFCQQVIDGGNGGLWLIANSVLYRFEPSTGAITSYKSSLSRRAGIERVGIAVRDNNGLLWVSGSSQPLAVLAPQPAFLLESFVADSPHSLNDDAIWSIYADDHQLWFGGVGQMHRFDQNTHEMVHVAPQDILPDDSIFDMEAFDDRHLLLATVDGIRLFDVAAMQTVDMSPWVTNSDLLRGKLIFSLTHIDSRWWIASANGMFVWDTNTATIVPVAAAQTPEASPSRYMFGVWQDRQQQLWMFGDQTFGYFPTLERPFVSLYDTVAQQIQRDISISQVMQVEPNVLWLATRNDELWQFNIDTQQVLSLTNQWGLACHSVYFLTQTPDFRIIACEDKIVRQRKLDGSIEAFGQSDGLIARELNENAFWLDQQQHLYVGSPKGAMKLDVAAMRKRIPYQHTLLESATVYYDDAIELSLVPQNGMTIKPGAKLVTFQFSNLDYLSLEKLALKYRLLKMGSRDVPPYLQLDSQTQVNLSGLDAGSYRLEVLGQNDGVWERAPLVFRFNVQLYWWQNTWVKLAFLSLLLLGLLGIIVYRQRQVKSFKHINAALVFSDERLRQSLRGSDSDLWEWHRQGDRLSLQNHGNVLGGERHEIIMSLADLPIHPDDRPYVMERWLQMLAGEVDNFECEYRYQRLDGSWGWLRIRGRPTAFDANGQIIKASGIYSECTQTRLLEKEAHLLARAFENTSEGMFIVDAAEHIEVSNLAAENLLGVTASQLIGQPISRFIVTLAAPMAELLKDQDSWAGESQLYSPQMDKLPIWLNVSTIKNARQQLQYYVLVFSDISARKASEAELRKLANYDVLTSLPNRSLFAQRLERAMARAESQQHKLSLLFLDLDRFKQVNDYYGHSMGDALLVEAANRLQSVLDDDAVLCRFGGDEFVILVNSGDIDHINRLCEAMLAQISSPFKLFGREFFISTSIGISIWPDDTRQAEALIKNADQAMYDAKDRGRGNFQYYSSERNAEALYHLRLEGDLRKALEQDQFELHYQGQFDLLQDDRIIGVEALIRWQHPRDGHVRPDIFIKVAESCGLIVDIDRWVLKQACRHGAIWCASMPLFRMSVNISAVHFRQPDFIEVVSQILHDTGMPAAQLTLEITEGVLMKELHVACEHLQQLRSMGIEVAIDDFGTGYSSLAYLRHFAVNTLKIDRSFLIDIASNSADQAIVSSIIEIARNLKLKVVAEGVETKEQLEQVFSRGCYLIQGYYFGKPVSAENLELQLQQQASLQK